jgi:hypothetical protein
MNNPMLPQPQVSKLSVAFQFGTEDATSGAAFAPEMVFIQRRDQVEYSRGYEAVAGVSTFTAAFTGSVISTPVVVPNYRRNDNEFVRRTDQNVTRIFQANAARDRRIERAMEETASFLGGVLAGDCIFA